MKNISHDIDHKMFLDMLYSTDSNDSEERIQMMSEYLTNLLSECIRLNDYSKIENLISMIDLSQCTEFSYIFTLRVLFPFKLMVENWIQLRDNYKKILSESDKNLYMNGLFNE